MKLEEKINQAKKVLQLAAELSETYYHAPLIITYSGGKDSDVMLNLAIEALKPNQFEVMNSHTTVDAPETVYYIRDKFHKLNEKGIKTIISMPRYKGKPTSMWQLIEDNGVYPTANMRFCCRYLKETTTPNRIIAVGIREDESTKRANRDFFSLRAGNLKKAIFLSSEHIREQFESSKQITAELCQPIETPNAYDCKFIEGAKKNEDALVYPIYYFNEHDIWEYIHKHNMVVNPLYSRGYKRIGCIGCPLAGPANMRRDFANYPKYKENYIKAFDRMLKKRREAGRPYIGCETGEEVMKKWLRENPKQLSIEDIMKDD